MRRLGAKVHPWMSNGAHKFVGETALSWAAAQKTRLNFSGEQSHIAHNCDLVLIAPASANFLAKIANGFVDTAAQALVLSALGQKKPIFILPTMHNDLYKVKCSKKPPKP